MSIFPKSRSRIRREASDWVVRLGGHGGAEDRAAFKRWHDADPRHAEAYDRVAGIWNQARQLTRLPAVGHRQTAAAAERPRTYGFALAASLAAAVLVSAFLIGLRLMPGSASGQETMVFASAVGEIRQVDLPDGSTLILDSASRVETDFSRTDRRLVLKAGRARFQVAHEARPFSVRAGSSEVLATGTLFDVSLIGGRTAVILLEGSVEVRAGTRSVVGRPPERLKPGQKLVLMASAPEARLRVTRGDAVWPERMLAFDDTRLDDVAAQANRYSKLQLGLADDRIRSLRVSGGFRAGDTAGLAQSLATAFDLRVVGRPDGSLLLVNARPRAHAPASESPAPSPENISGG